MDFHGKHTGESTTEKIYVQSSQIAINNEGIFVHIENEWIPAESIGFDSLGLFAAKFSNPDHSPWKCRRCGFINAYWSDNCQGPWGDGKCLAPRPPK